MIQRGEGSLDRKGQSGIRQADDEIAAGDRSFNRGEEIGKGKPEYGPAFLYTCGA